MRISRLIRFLGLIFLMNILFSVNSLGQQNFVRTWTSQAPGNLQNDISNKNLRQVREETTYFDGLGRTSQTVQRKASLITNPSDILNSSSSVDLVKATAYNEVGLEEYLYPAFAANNYGGNTHISDGQFKSNPIDQLYTFYSSSSGPLANQNEANYYGVVQYEPSSANRVLESFMPGVNWAGTAGATNPVDRRSAKVKTVGNTAADKVRVWNIVSASGTFAGYQSTAIYGAAELIKTIKTDPNGKQIITFTNKQGQLILKKIQLTAGGLDNGAGLGHNDFLCTYYIYDDFDQLRAVLQPEGVALLDPDSGSGLGWNLMSSASILNGQVFRYEYDDQNRMIAKKIPGAAEEYFVYDARDRLVMTQDGNLREAGKWAISFYDEMNRPVETGVWDNTSSHSYHIGQASTSTAYPFAPSGTSFTGYELLSRTGYDNYVSLPVVNGLSSTFDNNYNTYLFGSYNASPEYAEQAAPTDRNIDKATWTQVKILGTNDTYLYAVTIYDKKGRVIQIKASNISGGMDIVTTQYNWTGQPLIVVSKTEKAGTNPQTSVVVFQYTYDDLGRVVKVENKLRNTLVNSNALSANTVISTMEYDELGRVKRKTIGSKKNSLNTYITPRQHLEELIYDYNIQGWLLGVNRVFAKNDNQTQNYFGYELGYDKPTSIAGFATPQYDGNIAGTIWKSQGNNIRRKYDFGYDNTGRLLKADFIQNKEGAWSTNDANFNFKIGDGVNVTSAYDRNGNIKKLQQWGLKIIGNTQMDEMEYVYFSNSNRLHSINELGSGATDHKLSDFTDRNAGSIDYGYDKNGNLTTDLNKGIIGSTGEDLQMSQGAIKYNYLDQPTEIQIKDGNNIKGKITYTYDAAGNKLKKVIEEYALAYNNNKWTTTTFLYIGGAVYESKVDNRPETNDYVETLRFISHEDGRIRFKDAGGVARFEYDYMLKDQVNNVRMVLTEEKQTDIYPIATLDPSYSQLEQQFYGINPANIIDASQVSGLPSYINDNGIGSVSQSPSFISATSNYLYALNSNTGKIGLGITLKVMSGDKVDVFGKSYYNVNNVGGWAANSAPTVLSLLESILGSTAGSPLNAHGGASVYNTITDITSPITGFIFEPDRNDGQNTQRPKAAINWILFDDQLKYVNSHFSIVEQNGVLKDHYTADAQLRDIPITENGYIYIYVSNESPVNVYFDNLQVSHRRGGILEETHYYPMGLVQQGISTAALNSTIPQNRFKYGGKEEQKGEFSDLSGLDWLDFGARAYDPQIGRWLSVDPMAEKGRRWSPYNNAFNNPIRFVDPDGMWPDDPGILGRMAGNYFNSRFSSPSGPIRQKQLTEQEKALNYIWGVYERNMAPVSEKLKAIGDILSGFVPFKDAVDEAKNGNYVTAAVFGAVDMFGGFIEKGVGKLVGKGIAKITLRETAEIGTKAAVKEFDHAAVKLAAEGSSKEGTTAVYRNFGWNEYKALRASGNNFQIGSNFGSKQFWLDKKGIDWWNSTSFSKNFTAKITVNNSALQHGTNFLDAGRYKAISFDSQKALDVFNKNMKIEWVQYK